MPTPESRGVLYNELFNCTFRSTASRITSSAKVSTRGSTTPTAVLRGLIYLLVDQQPSLISHARTEQVLFENVNA